MISHQSDLQSLFLSAKKERTLLLSHSPFLFLCSHFQKLLICEKRSSAMYISWGFTCRDVLYLLNASHISTAELGIMSSFISWIKWGCWVIYSYCDIAINLHPTTLLLLPLNFAAFLIGWFVLWSCPIKGDNFRLGQASESVHITFHWQSVDQLALHQSQMEYSFLGLRPDAAQWLMRTLIASGPCIGKGKKITEWEKA